MTAMSDFLFFENVSRGSASLVISAAITCIHDILANSIASGVWPNCFNPTVFSAPSEVFTTFCVSSGDGVYPVSRTCHPRASAVRIMLPTLYAERIFSRIMTFMINNSECKIQNSEMFLYYTFLCFNIFSTNEITNTKSNQCDSNNTVHDIFECMIIF